MTAVNNFSIKEESKLLVETNLMLETMINGNTYKNLEKKNKKLLSRFEGMTEKNDLIFYRILNPLYINKNKTMKFSIDKNGLNDLFLDYKEKRNNNEIYSSELYELLNPYYLVEKKKFLNRKHISKEILDEFKEEAELINERQKNKDKNQLYDKGSNILFKLATKEDKSNKIKNIKLINDCINDNCLIVRLKNNEDNIFDKILLLKPDFTIDELKLLIKFIYKVKYEKQFIDIKDLYYEDSLYNYLKIENVKCLGDLAKKLKEKYELTIYIDAQY